MHESRRLYKLGIPPDAKRAAERDPRIVTIWRYEWPYYERRHVFVKNADGGWDHSHSEYANMQPGQRRPGWIGRSAKGGLLAKGGHVRTHQGTASWGRR